MQNPYIHAAKGPPLPILETIYRGLHAALTRDAALKKSLVLFLPYYIQYEGTGYRVMLIDPAEKLGLKPEREDAKNFFENNKAIIAKAIETGRDTRSLAHISVDKINKERRPGARIHAENNGHVQYRVLIRQSGTTSPIPSGEYDVAGSCPHLYPALGVLCQFDGKAIGMVSMDFDDQLCEKIEAAFNTFMEPFEDLSLWREFPSASLVEYFKAAEMADSWCKAGDNTLHNGFSCETEVTKVTEEIGKKLTEQGIGRLQTILSATTDLEIKHKLLKAIQGSNEFVPAVWIALTNGIRNDVPNVLGAAQFTPHLAMVENGNREQLREVCVAAGKVYGEWAWEDCAYLDPWILLKGKSDDPSLSVAQKVLMPRRPHEGGFTEKLWGLAEAIAGAWPSKWERLVEVRIVSDPERDAAAALGTYFQKTPVGVILGGDKKMFVAVRGCWSEA